jgi:hypothetical protein
MSGSSSKAFMVTNLVMMVIVDVVIALFVKDWDSLHIFTLVMVSVPFILACLIPFITPKGEHEYVYNVSTMVTTSIYAVIQIAIAVVILVTGWNGVIPYIVQIILLVAFVLVVFLVTLSNHSVEKSQAPKKNDQKIIWAARVEMKDAYDRADRETREVIKKAVDSVNAVSGYGDAYVEIDNRIMDCSKSLVSAVSSGDIDQVRSICAEIDVLCRDRKRIR